MRTPTPHKPSPFSQNAHWILRIALASVFIFHGSMKLANLEGTSAMLQISMPETVLVALAETGGPILLLLGGFGTARIFDVATRIGALANIPVMIGAIAMVHWGQWNFAPSATHPMGGMEFQTVLMAIMLFIAIRGNAGLRQSDIDANPLR